MTSKIKALFFDLDGTLVDTEPVAVRVVNECLKTWGIEPDASDAQAVTGRKWEAALEMIAAKYPLPVSLEACTKLVMERYRERLHSELIEIPGAVESVRVLSEHFPLALVSGSSRQDILWILTKLGISGCFKRVFGSEDYRESKPSPEGYLKAMSQLGVLGSSGLVFEDSGAGIKSARAAGLWVVAVRCSNHYAQDQSEAHHSVLDLRGVDPQWIKQLALVSSQS